MTSFGRGILYIATGPRFRAEALASAKSVKEVWPDLPLAIVSDEQPECDYFSHTQIVNGHINSRDKPRYIKLSPFERTVFLDTDTWCCAAFPEVFDLLDRFDLIAAYDDGRFTERTDPQTGAPAFILPPGIPESLPEFNTGVIAFRSSPTVLAMFDQWLDEYDAGLNGPFDHRDQPSFRAIVYRTDLRVGVLPSEYNFRLICPGFARNAIKIIHGRWPYDPIADTPAGTFRAIDRAFNASHGPRVFVPSLGMIYGHGPLAISPADTDNVIVLAPASAQADSQGSA